MRIIFVASPCVVNMCRRYRVFSITPSFLQPHFEKIKFPKRTFSLPSIYGIIVSPKRLAYTTFNLMKLPSAQTHEIYVNFGVRLVWPLLHVHICRIINSFLFSSGLARRLNIFVLIMDMWITAHSEISLEKVVEPEKNVERPECALAQLSWRARSGPKRAEPNYAETIRGPAHNQRDGMSRSRERRERVQIEINDSLLAFVLLGVRDDTSCARTTRKVNELKIVGHYFSLSVLMTPLARLFSASVHYSVYVSHGFLSSSSVERIKPSQQPIYITHRYAKFVFVEFRT